MNNSVPADIDRQEPRQPATCCDSSCSCADTNRSTTSRQQSPSTGARRCDCKSTASMTLSVSPSKQITHQILLQIGRCAKSAKREDPAALYELVIWLVEQLKPQGPMETMVVSQAVASHLITMKELGSLARESDLQAAGTRASIITKLQKSFNQHLNLLASLRGLRQQQVRIERIDINGGQAIVGSQVERGAA